MKDKLDPSSLLMFENSELIGDSLALESTIDSGFAAKKTWVIYKVLKDATAEKDFLNKLLLAVNLTVEDFAQIELENTTPNIWRLISSARPKRILCFGEFLTTPAIDLSNSFYKKLTINQIDILIGHELNEIMQHAEHKKALWSGLKKMFEITT